MQGNADPDLELLLAETRVLWGTDSLGRYEEPPLCTVVISAAAHRVRTSPGLDDDLAESLRHILDSWTLTLPASELRPALTSALPLLEVAGISGEVHGGPSFLIESLPAVPPGATVASSATPGDVAGTPRPPGWEPTTWGALLGGALGPWAMLLSEGQVLSICHTSRDSPAGAEAGIWSDPRSSGPEDAAAIMAPWADLMRQRDNRPLFYRTADDSPQQLAATPGLRPIGWIWSLHPA